MTLYLDSCLLFFEEKKEAITRLVELANNALHDHGQRKIIRPFYEDDCEYNASASIMPMRPGLLNRWRKTQKEYGVHITNGLFVRLCYLYEIYTAISHRHNDRQPRNRHDIFIHYDQRERAAVNLMQPNFFGFNLAESFKRAFEESANLERASEIFETEFWPFEFDRRPISAAAKTCVSVATDFIVLHECAHVTRGHLDYMKEQWSLNLLPELGEARKIIDPKMAFHMELDADMQAIASQLQGYTEVQTKPTKDLISSYLSILAFLYASFDFSARTISRYTEQEHPDPDIRYLLMLGYFKAAITAELDDDVAEYMSTASHSAVSMALQVQRECGIRGGGFSIALARQSNAQVDKAVSEISQRWANESGFFQSQWKDRIGRNNTTIFT